MPKQKTHSGAKKRFKKTKNGYKRGAKNRRHILTKKSTKRKRHLRGTRSVSKADRSVIDRLLVN